jgi:hypothetical protein
VDILKANRGHVKLRPKKLRTRNFGPKAHECRLDLVKTVTPVMDNFEENAEYNEPPKQTMSLIIRSRPLVLNIKKKRKKVRKLKRDISELNMLDNHLKHENGIIKERNV